VTRQQKVRLGTSIVGKVQPSKPVIYNLLKISNMTQVLVLNITTPHNIYDNGVVVVTKTVKQFI